MAELEREIPIDRVSFEAGINVALNEIRQSLSAANSINMNKMLRRLIQGIEAQAQHLKAEAERIAKEEEND